jgi:hypothetical protein
VGSGPGKNTVGAMALARATALPRSLSNAILEMFYKHLDLKFLLIEIMPLYNRFLKKFEICF